MIFNAGLEKHNQVQEKSYKLHYVVSKTNE
jgi:hypothetical protein